MAPKTIFGTTEKSNFILNMKPETLRKFITAMLVICAVLPFVGGFLSTINDGLKFLGLAFLLISGFFSVLLFVVCLLKKDVFFHKNISYFLIFAITILAVISAVLAYDTYISLFGNQGRYEGLLAILSYTGIFIAGTLVVQKEDIKKIFDIIVVIGILQSIIGIFQSSGLMPSGFENLYAVALDNVNLATGTSVSPIFFGTFLTIASGIAISGLCYDKSTNRKILYGCGVILFAVNAFLTQSIVPLIGIPTAFVIILIAEIIRRRKNTEKSKNFFSSPFGILLCVFASFAVITCSFALFNGVKIMDKGIAWQDSFYKNFVSGQLSYKLEGFYSHTWGESVNIIKAHPLEGTGPDCLVYAQVTNGNIPGSVNTFDKPYNDYLYLAATRGIPSLLIYLALIFFAVKKMVPDLKAFLNDKDNWYRIALFSSLSAYLIIMFFSASSIYVAPYFWLLLGMVFSKKLEN